MSTVMQTQPTIQLLLSSPDYVGALDLIHTTEDLLKQELAGIHSFRYGLIYGFSSYCIINCLNNVLHC